MVPQQTVRQYLVNNSRTVEKQKYRTAQHQKTQQNNSTAEQQKKQCKQTAEQEENARAARN